MITSHEYERTGLLYVDMVAAAVAHYKRQMWMRRRALKTIYLHPKGWDQFTTWARRKMTEEQADAHVESYTFEGVEVKLNSQLMGEKIYFDFAEEEKQVVN